MSMATTVEALIAGMQHHQAGRVREAEAVFRQVLQVEPSSVFTRLVPCQKAQP